VRNGVHLWHAPRVQRKKRTLQRAKALEWGVMLFRLRRKIYIPHSNGEREGTMFPHTPAGEPRAMSSMLVHPLNGYA
jgi:hypothetical protein